MKIIVIKNAQLLDGTGAPERSSDVVIRGDRIASIHDNLNTPATSGLHEDADEIIDAKGLTLAPGFIDVHTHDDAEVLRDPRMLPKLSQGVTTVITGNCGLSLVPLVTKQPEPPFDLLHSSQFRFPQLNDYAQALEQCQPFVNVAALIGHTSLRATVMRDLSIAATPAETQAMVELLDEAMKQGALGLSSGLFYQQAFAADTAEMKELVKVVGRHGGTYVTHIRNEMDGILDAIHEAAHTANIGAANWVLSHHKCAGPRNWGRTVETLALLEQLAQKQKIGIDVYPYRAGSTLLREDLIDGVIEVLITRSKPHPEMVGRYLADIANDWGLDQLAAAKRLMPGGACYFQMHEEDVRRVLAHPFSMIGSDGLPHDERPHPRLWGTFARVLGHYCRKEKLFDWPQAIYKMTGLSARRFGLVDRGVLQVGAFADAVLFDRAQILDTATYEHPLKMCLGIHRVLVNGQWAFVNAQVTGKGAGRFLRRI